VRRPLDQEDGKMQIAALFDRLSRRISREIGRRLRIAPYDYVQLDAQKNLHLYLHKSRDEVSKLVMVGAHLAFEVSDMLRRFPRMEAILFEASPRYGTALEKRFSGENRVRVFKCAVGENNDAVTFFETNLAGSGSLLPVGLLAEESYGMLNAESYSVDCYRLDDHAQANGYNTDDLDCLWIDVQGAELQVLRGATETLRRVKSVFIEISVFKPLYRGGAEAKLVIQALENHGFRLVSAGTDYSNGTGNAFFVKMRGQ
jgi:FkbM family methyltransferase